MTALGSAGVSVVYHYAPLHYLPFIARAGALMGKPSLRKAGFPATHLRSKSNKQDVARGFGGYVHLTLDPRPRILQAKLAAGFPHIAIAVPSSAVEASNYSLCRFNVAMTRYLRRGDKPGFAPSPTNGRYYPGHEIPIAKTSPDKQALLKAHLNKSMIEVLIDGDLALPPDTGIECYAPADKKLADKIISATRRPWAVTLNAPPGSYPRSPTYAASVASYVAHALADPNWRGNGLEFDRV